MKNRLNIPVILISIALMYSCTSHDYYMYTKINADGSCYREFVQSTDSAFFAGDTSRNPFPMKIDSTWELTRFIKNLKDSSWFKEYPSNRNYKQGDSTWSFYARAWKYYPSIDELSGTFRFNNSNWDSLVPKIIYKKTFKWFYSYYTYCESYPPVNPFKLVPVNEYLTDDEIDTWFGENKNLYVGKNGIEASDMLTKLEEKVDAWLEKSYYEEVFRQYLKCYPQFKDMPVDSAKFAQEKESIYRFIKDSLDDHSDEGINFEDNYAKAFDLYFQTNAFSNNVINDLDDRLEEEIPDFTGFFNTELHYRLSMPGKILETNAPFINGDTLYWKVDANRFFVKDYCLTAESRKPNYWTFGITGVIIVLTILGFCVKRKV